FAQRCSPRLHAEQEISTLGRSKWRKRKAANVNLSIQAQTSVTCDVRRKDGSTKLSMWAGHSRRIDGSTRSMLFHPARAIAPIRNDATTKFHEQFKNRKLERSRDE